MTSDGPAGGTPAGGEPTGRTRPARARRELGRAAVTWLLVLVLVGLVVAGGGYAAYYFGYLDRFLCEGGECTAKDVLPPEELDLPQAREPGPVLQAPQAPRVSPYKVRTTVRDLLRDKDLGKHVGFAVRDLTRGEDVWSYGKGTFIPASTLKLFTALAALETIEPGTRFTTSVTRQGRDLVLVGGGDPYLAAKPPKPKADAYPKRASLSVLAKRTARELRKQDITSVRLAFDDSLFTGPAISSRWENDYVPDVTTPVSALWVDQGAGAGDGVRSRRPAREASRQFAKALRKRGVKVSTTGRASATSGSPVARVRSASIEKIVQSLVGHSDNEATEVVLRHVALASGRKASFSGGVRAVRETLTGMGVRWKGVRMVDGSGLSRDNRVSLTSVLDVLERAADAGLADDLPVAGFSGSLADRYAGSGTAGGWGLVRAKTGTLSRVHGLAGITVDADGTPLAFVVLTDKVKLKNTLDARLTLERVTARLAGCSCRPR